MRSLILSTPLRYPGGKSKVVKDLYEYMPEMSQYDEWREPFLGGGSMSIEITKKFPDMKIWVNDLYPALFNFWTMVKDRGDEMTERLLEIKSECITIEIAKSFHIEQKKIINDDASSDFDKAVAFYYANKNSFSGLTETGTFSESSHYSSFTITNIGKLTYYQKLIRNWKFTNGSYDVLLKDNNPKAFVYLDPPYELKDSRLYGKNGSMHLTFDHDEFAKNCNECGLDAMISYNADQFVKDRFDGWNQFELEWNYSMRSNLRTYVEEQKGRKELVLTNYNIEQGSLEAFL
jgi:DNA adenine methylase